MSNTSNFREAIAQAKTHALVGPNVIANALPYVGGGSNANRIRHLRRNWHHPR